MFLICSGNTIYSAKVLSLNQRQKFNQKILWWDNMWYRRILLWNYIGMYSSPIFSAELLFLMWIRLYECEVPFNEREVRFLRKRCTVLRMRITILQIRSTVLRMQPTVLRMRTTVLRMRTTVSGKIEGRQK